ncbi:MAG: mechanosensitive ion channel [Lachnospiraceae bacterium]|nr:mechanosensitive ion channel [Ruminococcus sp.]MCM1275337.1 mechanosensitive ion channel [Lachnospiraceae bacterium]
MSAYLLLAEAAETHEATLGDAVHDLVEKPEETLSTIGNFFQGLGNALLSVIPTILFAVAVLILGLILSKLVLALLSKGLSKTKLELTVTKFTSQMAKIVLYTLLITIVLNILGIPATSIVTVIGTAGVAIGLALQNSLSNVAGGFLLMITKPFKIGDYIITNGVEGTVSQISILHTRLDSATNQAVFVPNGLAINATIINNNGNDTRRVDLKFSISYNDDFETARSVILGLIEEHPLVLKSVEPTVRMLEHGESAIIIAARAWCNTSDYWTVYFDLTERVRAAFIENGIEIPFKQMDVHVVE